MPNLLRTLDLTVTYGGLTAVNALSIELAPGQLVGLIGPNGAGKTTFIDALTGFVPTTSATVVHGARGSRCSASTRARSSPLSATDSCI